MWATQRLTPIAGHGSDAAEDDADHAAGDRRDVRVLPRRPGAVLGHQRQPRPAAAVVDTRALRPAACRPRPDAPHAPRQARHPARASLRSCRHVHARATPSPPSPPPPAPAASASCACRARRAARSREAHLRRATAAAPRAPRALPRCGRRHHRRRHRAVFRRAAPATPARTWSSCRRTAARSLLQRLVARCCELGARMARAGRIQRTRVPQRQARSRPGRSRRRPDRGRRRSARRAPRGARSTANSRSASMRWRAQLLALRVQVEAAIDFADEPLDTLGMPRRCAHGSRVRATMAHAARQPPQRGRKLRDGLHAVIVGPPNAGKSSLLNALAGSERAIVTDIAGTTRDLLRETVRIDGVELTLVDTAGLREGGDVIEREGMRRARAELAARGPGDRRARCARTGCRPRAPSPTRSRDVPRQLWLHNKSDLLDDADARRPEPTRCGVGAHRRGPGRAARATAAHFAGRWPAAAKVPSPRAPATSTRCGGPAAICDAAAAALARRAARPGRRGPALRPRRAGRDHRAGRPGCATGSHFFDLLHRQVARSPRSGAPAS